jgi:hypothetical protein
MAIELGMSLSPHDAIGVLTNMALGQVTDDWRCKALPAPEEVGTPRSDQGVIQIKPRRDRKVESLQV